MVSSHHSGSRSRSRSRSRGVRNLRARAHAERSGHEARPGDDAWVSKVHRKRLLKLLFGSRFVPSIKTVPRQMPPRQSRSRSQRGHADSRYVSQKVPPRLPARVKQRIQELKVLAKWR